MSILYQILWELLATTNYHSSILRPWCQSTWTNTLPRHFCRGPASHQPFDFLPYIYPFYMFYTAKPFSAFSTCRRVRNHYSKRILNLILNRKKFLGRGNEGLDKQKTAAKPRFYTQREGESKVRQSMVHYSATPSQSGKAIRSYPLSHCLPL